jgi:thioesterase domain-containing protein
MSAAALLSELRRRAIQLRAQGSELHLSAPAGALTTELREQLRRYKQDLLALLASAQAHAAQARAIVPLQPNGTQLPVFGVGGHNGDVFCYRILAQCLGEEQPFYGLQPPGLDGEADPLTSVKELAAYFAAQIAAFGPQGPCIVAGYCAGGAVAFELAQQLAARGTAVRFVALFGCPYPTYFTRQIQLVLGLRRACAHARELASRAASERRKYLVEKLSVQKAKRNAARAAALDPVLARRMKVERATLAAVRRYAPRRFDGRLKLFVPGPQWRDSGVAAARWRALATEVQEYCGPAASDGVNMLREVHAPAFAELFRRARAGLE